MTKSLRGNNSEFGERNHRKDNFRSFLKTVI